MGTLLVFVLLASFASAGLSAKFFTFNVDYQDITPDCVTKRVAVVNGQYPGPGIYARSGETIVVTVNNRLREGLTIHWHGLHQRGKDVWQDGGAFGSQCPIPPAGTYTYNFRTSGQWGTFWWHAHAGLLRASVHGALVILPPRGMKEPFPVPAKVFTILINDWYWRSNEQLMSGLDQAGSPYAPFGRPDSLHLNGRSRTRCRAYFNACRQKRPCLPCNSSRASQCNVLRTFTVVKGLTYRFRLVNVGLYGSINLHFQGHTFSVVEADGNYIKPVTQSSIDILPGETFSVLLTADQNSGNYWIAANGRFDSDGSVPGVAVLRYRRVLAARPRGPIPHIHTSDPRDNKFSIRQQNSFKSLRPSSIQGLKITKRITLRWGVHQLNGKFLYSVNNVSYVNSGVPVQYADWVNAPGVFDLQTMNPQGLKLPAYAGTPCKVGTSALDIPLNAVVQIVLQNNAPPGLEHPWHLHGYDFWVVGSGPGTYDPDREWSYNFNLVDPPLRNTVNVHDNQWVAIRFVANNPGMRQLHCHLEPHVHLGMQTYLRIHDPSLPGPPDNYLKSCPGHRKFPKAPVWNPVPAPQQHQQSSNVDFDWSALGAIAYVNITIDSTVTFVFGQSDGSAHSITPMDPSLGAPGVGTAIYTATRALLAALPNQDGIAMRVDDKSSPHVQPPGFKKAIRFGTVGTYAFTCSMHIGTQTVIVGVTRTAPRVKPPQAPPKTRPPEGRLATPSIDNNVCPSAPSGPRPKASWYTQQSDNSRSGWQPNEYHLNPSNVKGGSFHLLNAKTVDAQVYAQPVVAPNVRLPTGQTVDVLIVATENNSVYAFNTDPTRFSMIWNINLGKAFTGPSSCTDLTPIIGITSTPVIDPTTSTVYVVTKSREGPSGVFRLHAIDLATGSHKSSAPITATYSANGKTVTFNSWIQHQRSALTLYNGIVWIAFASHCDYSDYHGWVIGMSTRTLSVVKQYATTMSTGGYGAIWMSGQGPAVSKGFMYAATGNGRVDGTTDVSQTIFKLDLNSGPNMKLADYFRPTYPTSRTYQGDMDLGSGGVVLMQDQAEGETLAQAGKARILYVVKTSDMKKDCNPCNQEDGHAHQRIVLEGGSVFSSGAYWPRVPGRESYFYIHNGAGYSAGKGLSQFVVRGGKLSGPVKYGERTELFHPRGATPVVSSDRCRNGIVWEVGQGTNKNARLLAWDALTLQLLYNSDAAGQTLGRYMKFSTPAVANGFVYVAYDGGIAQFGLR